MSTVQTIVFKMMTLNCKYQQLKRKNFQKLGFKYQELNPAGLGAKHLDHREGEKNKIK